MWNCYPNHKHIYTDGSVTATSSAVGIWVPSTRTTIAARLSHKTTSTTSELAALRSALQYILGQEASVWVIFTDSRAALQQLASFPREQLAHEIHTLHTQAARMLHEVVLQWLPGHCGVNGNVVADETACAAHTQSSVIIPIPFSRRDAATLAYSVARQSQLSTWTDGTKNYQPLYRIDPACTFRMPCGLGKRDEAVVHRIRLNVAFTSHYLHKTRRVASPHCQVCSVREDIEHVLCVCPRYDTPRLTWKTTLGLRADAPLKLCDAIGPWHSTAAATRSTRALVSFLRDSGLNETL